ncbi:MAG: ABC transporter ATP-binding protein, partial [Desulfobacteraceae bacterium]
MDSPLIHVKNLRVSFFTKLGEVKAVDGLSYEIQKGKTLGIVGESGCGKSVASYAILGLLSYPGRIVGGEILFKGEDISRYTREQYENLRGNQITMVFQEALTALNPVLTIGYQITEQIIRHLFYSRKQAVRRAVELLDLVGIPSPAKRLAEYPHQLSGGMKQRAMIAMALSCNPDLFIADEPTTALDVTIQAQILDLVQSLQERLHMTVQYITHDLGVISELADDIIVMYAGRIVESGPNQKIFNNPMHPYT